MNRRVFFLSQWYFRSILRWTSQEILSFFAASPLLLNKQSDAEKMETDAEEAMDADERVVPQILVLYYLLLYEDVRMSQIKAITVSKSKSILLVYLLLGNDLEGFGQLSAYPLPKIFLSPTNRNCLSVTMR